MGRLKKRVRDICQAKKRYPDEASARASALHIHDVEEKPIDLFVYRCPHCSGYHLTKHRNHGWKTNTGAFEFDARVKA